MINQDDYNRKLKLASAMLEEALKNANENEKFFRYLFGVGLFEIKGRTIEGYSEHAFNITMDAIYKKYESYPEIKNMYYSTMEEKCACAKTYKMIYDIFRIIEYQIFAEKNGIAPFKIDYEKLLNILKNNLIKNKETIRQVPGNEHGFDSMINTHFASIEALRKH